MPLPGGRKIEWCRWGEGRGRRVVERFVNRGLSTLRTKEGKRSPVEAEERNDEPLPCSVNLEGGEVDSA